MKNGKGTAFITGASAGIGETFARHLAEQQYDLILTARREELLDDLAQNLAGKYSVKVEIIPADLSITSDVRRLANRISESDDLTMLVNNAGFGYPGTIAEADIEILDNMNSVLIDAPLRLCNAALPGMIDRQHGYIINVSSVAAFFAGPGSAVYSATKAYLNSISQALQIENADYGIKVQALCPGFTHTELHDTETMTDFDKAEVPSWMWNDTDFVVSESLRKLNSNKVICIPGWKYKLIVWMARGRFTRSLLLKHARSHYKQRMKIKTED